MASSQACFANWSIVEFFRPLTLGAAFVAWILSAFQCFDDMPLSKQKYLMKETRDVSKVTFVRRGATSVRVERTWAR
jgi:hypothetical protein